MVFKVRVSAAMTSCSVSLGLCGAQRYWKFCWILLVFICLVWVLLTGLRIRLRRVEENSFLLGRGRETIVNTRLGSVPSTAWATREFRAREQGRVGGWKITQRKHQGDREGVLAALT